MGGLNIPAWTCSEAPLNSPPAWLPAGGFLALIAGIIVMFWGLTFICEEYCVPSITVFCKRNRISDDIAGAIFIGTGLSLPVLFASVVGLFVSHSGIGVGTVVGGDAFNLLVNIGCSIYVSPNRTLKLDAVVFTREMLFYLLSCLLLIWAAEGADIPNALRHALSEDQWHSCLSITWASSLVLIANYVIYCLFDAYFQRMQDIFNRCTKKAHSPAADLLPSHVHAMMSPHNATSDAVLYQVSTRVENNVVNTIGSTTIALAPTSADVSGVRRHEAERKTKSIQMGVNNKKSLIYRNVSSMGEGEDDEGSEFTEIEFRHRSTGHEHGEAAATTSSHGGAHYSNISNSSSENETAATSPTSSRRPPNTSQVAPLPPIKRKLTPPTPDKAEIDRDDLIQDAAKMVDVDFDVEVGFGGGGGGSSNNTALTSHESGLMRPAEDTSAADELMDFGDFLLYLKSTFYTLNDFGCMPSSRKWKLRYFTLDDHGLRYRLEAHLPATGPHVRFIDIFDLESVTVLNVELFEFSIRLRHSGKKYTFRALDQVGFTAVTRKLRQFTEAWKLRPDGERTAMALKSMYEISNGYDSALVNPDSEAVGDDMFTVPSSWLARLLYLLVFPLKLAIYLTVPDVRRPGSEEKALLSISVCVIWLAAMSYVLIVSLTLIGNWWGISGSIMGLTVAAWAASYPALWSSIVVAKNGYGDVASCNALGSNVFSNYIGLGLPWIAYSAVYGGRPYQALRDDGVVMSVMLLIFILVAYYLMVALSGWTLRAWMVPIMLLTYVGFISYLVYFTYML